ncbi:hypothetical protein OWV82_024288 [Melia azedarach]|uniref:Uncharacterized protein n=1 Tax=Melia azedarach TaxID=155640 RepID=A0ACC1WPU1_MELAZ|nr:hypothetical protein OWV82_024288 [Melia azedarach]
MDRDHETRIHDLEQSIKSIHENYVSLHYQVYGMQGHVLNEFTLMKNTINNLIGTLNESRGPVKREVCDQSTQCNLNASGNLKVESEKIPLKGDFSHLKEAVPASKESSTQTESSTQNIPTYSKVTQTPKPITSPKEKPTVNKRIHAYLSYVKYLMTKKTTETWMDINSQKRLNKAIIHKGADPRFVRGLFDNGLINCIYPDKHCEVIKLLPRSVLEAAKTYFGITKSEQIYIRMYAAGPEPVNQLELFDTVQIIKMGVTKGPITGKHIIQDFNEEEQVDLMSYHRAMGFKAMYSELKEMIDKKQVLWIYDSGDPDLLIYSQSKVVQSPSRQKVLASWYDNLLNCELKITSQAAQHFCQLMRMEIAHECEYCADDASTDSYSGETAFIPT